MVRLFSLKDKDPAREVRYQGLGDSIPFLGVATLLVVNGDRVIMRSVGSFREPNRGLGGYAERIIFEFRTVVEMLAHGNYLDP